MDIKKILEEPERIAKDLVAYQRSEEVGDFGGPSGYNCPALRSSTVLFSPEQEAVDEANKQDPDPQIAPNVK